MARANTKQATTEDLEAQIAALKEDVQTLTNTMVDYGRSQKTHLSAVAADGVHALKTKAADGADVARQKAVSAYGEAEKLVSANPAQSVGIAAGLGFIVGLMASRK